jgi:hypothetical protein
MARHAWIGPIIATTALIAGPVLTQTKAGPIAAAPNHFTAVHLCA